MKKFKLLISIAIATIIALTIIANNTNSTLSQAKYAGQKLVMVTSADYPPYEYRDTASGKNEIIGFDVDIAKYIAQQLGFELEIKDTDFSGIIPALQSRRADFAMAGMTPTADLCSKQLGLRANAISD